MSKEIAKKAQETELMIAGIDLDADAGIGMETADRDSYAIPFLRVLQKISPQCDEADPAYIEGAKGGMLLNTVTRKLYKDGVTFLPCAFQRRFLQWGPRGGDGAGFKGEILPEDVALMKADGRAVESEGRLFLGEANEKKSDRLVDTRSHYGILVDEDGASQVILPLSSTQIKKSKQLMSMLASAKIRTAKGLVTPPTWMNKIKVSTVLESNDQGSWYGVKFEAEGFLSDKDLYDAGKSFHETVSAGEVRANFAADDDSPKSGKF